MYKKRKFQKLNSIDEDRTIKINRKDGEIKENVDVQSAATDGSEEHIPFSQEQTQQRYLSQRSILAATLPRTQSKNVSQMTANTHFELLLMRAGVKDSNSETFVLSCDVIAFVNKLREALLRHPSYPENLHSFKSGLRMALSTQSEMLQRLLTGCSIDSSDVVYQSQDSMLVNILMIDFLREPILEVLLDKIEEVAFKDTQVQTTEGIPILPLLLTQLQFLRHSHVDTIYPSIKKIVCSASEWAKWEIITHAEIILDASKHDEFAQLMLDTLLSTEELIRTTTIQAFINLSLSVKLQAKIQSKILAYIKYGQCSNIMLPLLIKFLLKVINEEHDDITMLINTLREILIEKLPSDTESNSLHRQVQLDIFTCIAQNLKYSRKLYLVWQKIIVRNVEIKYRSIDFIMLLIFAHIREDNSLYINNTIRRSIKNETINLEVLNEVRAKFSAVLEQYAVTLMQIIHDFLREKHVIVSEFARNAYEILFDICDTVRHDIIGKLIDLTFDKKMQNLTTLSLIMLRDLQCKYPKEVQNCDTLLLPLLDHLNEMSISQTRIIMNILCSIAYPPPNLNECAMLQEQIDMLIKKQLINRTTYVKKQGIIGCVQLINCIAQVDAATIQINDCNVTFDSVSDLPDGRGKIAANYILRIQSSTLYNAELLALFYDELASSFAVSTQNCNTVNYDTFFLAWLCETMTYNFQNNFICEQVPKSIQGFTLSNQKCINTRADTSTEGTDSEVLSVAINIGELVLCSKSQEASSSILVLGPLFKLIRVLNGLRNEGSLEAINALLGCSIILPIDFDNVETTFLSHNDDNKRKLLDAHFHCVNWMRETVSSFATQCEAMIRQKVLQRLTELIRIENKLRKLLEYSPVDYIPPMCQFITNISTTPAPGLPGRSKADIALRKDRRRKGPKNKATDDRELTLQSETLTTNLDDVTVARFNRSEKIAGGVKSDFDFVYGTKEIYRQMDSDLMLILREKLCLTFPMPMAVVGNKIGLLELHFILTDIVCKLESITGSATKFENEQSLQYIAKPDYFINDLSKFLGTIVENMQTLSDVIDNNLTKAGGAHGHHDLFNDECKYLKSCFGLSLRLLAAFFSESGFADKRKEILLKDGLVACLERKKALEMRNKTCGEIAVAVFTRFLHFEPFILELKSATFLYNLLRTISRFAIAISQSSSLGMFNADGDNDVGASCAKEMRVLCKKILSRKWYGYENNTIARGTSCNYYLDEIVKGFLKDSDFRRQKEILSAVLDEVGYLNNGKDASMRLFPNIRKANFPLLFRGLCDTLITHLNKQISLSKTTSDRLEIWEESSALLNIQLEIVQRVEVPRNYQPFLKYSLLYLKLLIQYGLPVLEAYLRQSPERISNFLKTLQITTRFLHNLCVHSKAMKQLTIISQIPCLRETIENLVFRVKALLVANKCANVFWMGSLKNKDLHGDEIVSQAASLEVNDEEELPEDDNSIDETIDEQNELELGYDDTSKSNRYNRSKSASRSKCI